MPREGSRGLPHEAGLGALREIGPSGPLLFLRFWASGWTAGHHLGFWERRWGWRSAGHRLLASPCHIPHEGHPSCKARIPEDPCKRQMDHLATHPAVPGCRKVLAALGSWKEDRPGYRGKGEQETGGMGRGREKTEDIWGKF